MSFAATACSCGGSGTTGQRAEFIPTLQADPTGEADYLVDFGVVLLGEQRIERIPVRNAGNRELVVMGERIEAPFSADLPSAGLKLGVGANGHIAFGFEPEEESDQPLQTIVSLVTNEGGKATYTFRLVGQGKRANLDCEPGELDFGPVPKGGSKALTTVCTNPLSIPIAVEGHRIRGSGSPFFEAVLDGAVDGELIVAAGGSVAVEVGFSALSVGMNEASLGLSGSFNQPIASLSLRAETVESSLALEPSSCLDFSYVGLGESAVAAFELRTIGRQPLRITSIELPQESETSFSILTQAPISLEPGAAAQQIEVEFHPTTGGPHQAQITIRTEGPLAGAQVVSACARGFGGGPALSCTPSAIDFGMIAVGMSARDAFDCINSGVTAPEAVIDPLVVTGIQSSAPEFVATILNPDGSEGLKERGYKLGEQFQVEVVYAPSAERFDSAKIQIETLSAPGGAYETSISGQGRELPSCEFSIEPSRLNFGIVDRGQERSLSFGIRNTLATPCLIRKLRLSPESDDAFSVTPIQGLELAGDELLEVEVTFAPQVYRALFTGAIEFEISNYAQSDQRIPLQGASEKPCVVIEPEVLDFGKVGKGCMSDDIWVSVTNVCQPPVEIIGLEINEAIGSDAFLIRKHPNFPRTLLTNERIEVQLAFLPSELRDYRGSLRVDVQDSMPYLSKMVGVSSSDLVQTDTFNQTANPKVDILWVIDNSSSFRRWKQRLAENLHSFLSAAYDQNVDFHLAVTSNGLRKTSNQCGGGALGGEDGRLFPIDGSHPRVLTPETPFIDMHWRFNVNVGVCHADEYHVEAAYRALSEPLINESKSSKHFSETPYNDGNAGFLRREASLSIIFASDEPDKSSKELYGMELKDYLAFFRGLKGKSMLRVHGVVGSKASQPTTCGLNNGDRIHYLIDETGGTWIDLCTPVDDAAAWDEGLRAMSLGAFGFRDRFILRGVADDITGDHRVTDEDIVLRVNGLEVPAVGPENERRWSFDEEGRAILFTPLFIPQTGSQITATYSVACNAL